MKLLAKLWSAIHDAASPVSSSRREANAALHRGDVESAIRHLRASLSADPRDIVALGQLAEICLARGELAAAESCARQGIEVQPTALVPLRVYGAVLIRMGKAHEAITHL